MLPPALRARSASLAVARYNVATESTFACHACTAAAGASWRRSGRTMNVLRPATRSPKFRVTSYDPAATNAPLIGRPAPSGSSPPLADGGGGSDGPRRFHVAVVAPRRV